MIRYPMCALSHCARHQIAMASQDKEKLHKLFERFAEEPANPIFTEANIARILAVIIAGIHREETGHWHVVWPRLIEPENCPLELNGLRGKRVFCIIDFFNFDAGSILMDDKRNVLQKDGETWARLSKDTDPLRLALHSNRPLTRVRDEDDITIKSAADVRTVCTDLIKRAEEYAARDIAREVDAIGVEIRLVGQSR